MAIEPRTTQKDRVLAYLKEGRSITPIKALHMFNAFRLADVIYRLKKDGHNIKTVVRKDTNGKTYAEYELG